MHAARRKFTLGFTLIELSVTLAVVAILIVLLLPAVQQARETARRTQCRSNLRQIALAMCNYHEVNSVFPINTSFTHDVGPLSITLSWLQGILPQIEQGSLSAEIDPSASVQVSFPIAQNSIPLYRCPSDLTNGRMNLRSDMPDEWVLGITNYKACSGSNWQFGNFISAEPTGRFSGSFDGLNHGNGLICAGFVGPVTTRVADISDGTSNTLAVGETVAGWTKWAWWYYSNGSIGTGAIPLNYKPDGVSYESNIADWHNNYGFLSRHPGGGNFAFADGSVRFVSEDMDLATYRGLATIQGGEAVGEY